ncbi:hypothetical protein PHAVU_009G056000 [Phaseolus vulgaris]|uniref:Calcium uniporter protein C-terminal domain-containing protein n=1 Tax=Phaseolus vulgaris TaxID=3885 RepID=V7AVE0_PHAVU|nr:hypothetical protein PHAVU_009G056000g [Phaseolus vulgaris]ESW08563.1 hypothetical protein PHAVU_009G056000g [Phaseolus vulgaris]
MALGKLSSKRLFDCVKMSFRILPNSPKPTSPCHYLISPESSEKGFFGRFLEARGLYGHSNVLSLPAENKLKDIGATVDLDVNHPNISGISVNDARKILRTSHMEKVKAKLRDIPHTSISYSHYFQICLQHCDHNHRQATEFAEILDHSGNVIVFGNVVFLHPEQVAKTMERLITESIANPKDPRREELEKMERQKAMIDEKAKAQVRGELYCGLGFLTVQTAGLMRLTFWELNWDVMEPICFYLTSVYFSLAYMFFLRTSTEPTFQGYFQSRFKSKQQRLMKIYNLDIQRYNDLCKACYSASYVPAKSQPLPPLTH